MKKYDAYKDSGVKWIGEIPNHWEAIKISRVHPDIVFRISKQPKITRNIQA